MIILLVLIMSMVKKFWKYFKLIQNEIVEGGTLAWITDGGARDVEEEKKNSTWLWFHWCEGWHSRMDPLSKVEGNKGIVAGEIIFSFCWKTIFIRDSTKFFHVEKYFLNEISHRYFFFLYQFEIFYKLFVLLKKLTLKL